MLLWSLKAVCAVISTILLGVIAMKIILGLFFGWVDIDFDGDGSADADVSSISAPKGVAWFLCAFCGYIALTDKMMPYDWLYAALCGVGSAVLIWLVYWGMYKLGKSDPRETNDDLIGREGDVIAVNDDKSCYFCTTKDGARAEFKGYVVNNQEELHIGDHIRLIAYDKTTNMFSLELCLS